MKKIYCLLLAFAAVACGGGQSVSGPVDLQETYEVEGVSFKMVPVSGGTFTMGAQADMRKVKGADSHHQVVLDAYGISAEPVSQAIWTAVMGKNPSSAQGDALPVDRVSWEDAEKFVKKLAKATGVPFVLPTEAMWEFASNEGVFEPLSGVREWCADSFTESPATELTRNPLYADDGSVKVVRAFASREGVAGYSKAGALTFRVAVVTGEPCPEAVVKAIVDQNPDREHVCANETVQAAGVKFNMIAVKGGTFKMGATPEQEEQAGEDEKPVHEVSVEDFEIAQTEVTVKQWLAVMGTLPIGNYEKFPDKPVINVSWYSAQMFILKLNEISGRKFRLPTEAEWEFAARGGVRSRGTRYAGSGDIASVAAYTKNTDGKPVNVRSKRPNELNIYDMCGNAWEWCQDRFAIYGQTAEPGSEWHVQRGGSCASPWDACRIANRSKMPAVNIKGTFGFRLAI